MRAKTPTINKKTTTRSIIILGSFRIVFTKLFTVSFVELFVFAEVFVLAPLTSSDSTEAPHLEQNNAESSNCVPHSVQ